MYAVFGLGNPDKEYDKTRHNIGFDVIDELASQMGVEVKTQGFMRYWKYWWRESDFGEATDLYES